MNIKRIKKIVKEHGFIDLGDNNSVVVDAGDGLTNLTYMSSRELQIWLGYDVE